MLDDKDNCVKIQALNALKAFSGIRKFRVKIQVSIRTSPESVGPFMATEGQLLKY